MFRYLKTKMEALRKKQQHKTEKTENVPTAPTINPAFVLSSETQVMQLPVNSSYNNGGSSMQVQHTTFSPIPVLSTPLNGNFTQPHFSQPSHSQTPFGYYPPHSHPVTNLQQQSFMPANNINQAPSYLVMQPSTTALVAGQPQPQSQTQANSENRSTQNELLSSIVGGIRTGIIDSFNEE